MKKLKLEIIMALKKGVIEMKKKIADSLSGILKVQILLDKKMGKVADKFKGI